jgi:hypothetical protein
MIRIVKMVFKPEMIEEFLVNFQEDKQKIRNFEGVEHLELLQDKANKNCYFTYSKWKSPEHLENYSNSDLFKGIWKVTKPMFAEKAQAWSVDSIEKLA